MVLYCSLLKGVARYTRRVGYFFTFFLVQCSRFFSRYALVGWTRLRVREQQGTQSKKYKGQKKRLEPVFIFNFLLFLSYFFLLFSTVLGYVCLSDNARIIELRLVGL